MAPELESPLVTRPLDELEVHWATASELYLILLAIHGVARALVALTVFFSAGHGPGL
jgi:hypothetical protein